MRVTPENGHGPGAGHEGDLALDDAGHVHFVDTYLADITLTRWTANGLGQVIFDFTRPILPSPEADDRPWIAAHGNGYVFYFSNDGSMRCASFHPGLPPRASRSAQARSPVTSAPLTLISARPR